MSDHPPAAAASASARDLIAAHGGRVTRTRVAVIEALQSSSHPLSHDEIGAALAADAIAHDRVTLYRALDWLVEQGIESMSLTPDTVVQTWLSLAGAQ